MLAEKLTITLENIKGIKRLEFNAPVKSGIYVLSGTNGCGKSTLMTALARISDKSAFTNQFIDTPFDSYDTSKITYQIGKGGIEKNVVYSKAKKNWIPHPKNISLSKETPFTQVVYISTSQQRFIESALRDLTGDALKGKQKTASDNVKTALKKILDSERFNKLKYQTITDKGAAAKTPTRRNKVYFIPKDDGTKFSELNFSLGERMVLNAIDAIESIKDRSLLLIDEIELALHPTAQVRFYDYLEGIAKEKNLMVIISTHSPTLIRYAKNRYYLEMDVNGNVFVKDNCLPAYILRDVTVQEETNPDFLLFVEDDQARRLLGIIIQEIKGQENCRSICTYRIVRVGGWEETIRLMKDFKAIPPYSGKSVQAFPDKDAEDEILNIQAKDDKTDSDTRRLNLWNECKHNITPLHITPELGIWNWLKANNNHLALQSLIEENYGPQIFTVRSLIDQVEATIETGKNDREKAKYRLMDIVKKLREQMPHIQWESFYDLIMTCYVRENYELIKNSYKLHLCQILGRTRKR